MFVEDILTFLISFEIRNFDLRDISNSSTMFEMQKRSYAPTFSEVICVTKNWIDNAYLIFHQTRIIVQNPHSAAKYTWVNRRKNERK